MTKRHWRKIHPLWGKAVTVPDREFVTRRDAQRELGLRWIGTVNIRLNHGHLTPAVTSPESFDLGVTRTSLDAEIRWWSAASPRERLKRHFGTALRNV